MTIYSCTCEHIRNLHSEESVLQSIDEWVEVSSNDDGEDILMVVKKLWADMAEAKQGKQEEP
ncbi:hypothetical protein A2U01_0074311, partial [Trifolium medium]|nr:hypothetical protein [Trifolium medium]